MNLPFTESVVEEATLAWFSELGYHILYGPDIAPEEPRAERASYTQVLLINRLRAAIHDALLPKLTSGKVRVK